jgi:hypothetical protein
MPRHFWRTVVVFRRYRPPSSVKKTGSSSRELGSPPESVVPASVRCHPDAFRGVSNLFATSALRVHCRWASQAHLCSVLSVSHALDGLLLALPCRLVSSCCHVQVSRSRGFLPRPVRYHLVGGPCLRAVGAVSCRRFDPTTPESVASTSRPAPGRDPQRLRECYPPQSPVSPHALPLLRARFTSLEGAIDTLSAHGLGCSVLAVPRTTNPQRVDRLATSMLYP